MIYGKNPDYEAIVVAAGVTGIYQIKMLSDLGIKSIVPEAADDLGGTGTRIAIRMLVRFESFVTNIHFEGCWTNGPGKSGFPDNLRTCVTSTSWPTSSICGSTCCSIAGPLR